MEASRWWTTECDAATEELLALLLSGNACQTTPSTYETARLVSLAPWLDGHAERLRFLVATQRPDGGWGGPGGYGLVPTLSATEALLRVLYQGLPGGPGRSCQILAEAADRALGALFRWLGTDARPAAPDTIGAEVLVPQLVGEINTCLDRLATDSRPERFARWSATSARLRLPAGMDDTVLLALRAAVLAGQQLPEKVWHSLECLRLDARAAAGVRATDGIVCGSPAATVAWLGAGDTPPATTDGAVPRLAALQARYGGPVPGIYPITVFEHAWVIAALADAGIDPAVPPPIVAGLRRACGPRGAPAAAGLPSDADDTAGVLYALARVGRPAPADCLWHYETERYFQCFAGERTPSVSTNGHVLDALLMSAGTDPKRTIAAVAKVVDWLLGRQEPDGSWWDKWHASPYYSTYVCAAALARSGHPGSVTAIRAALRWLLDTQRADGSWGRWQGTEEETSYAVQTLLHAGISRLPGRADVAAARGCAYLLRPGRVPDHTPLWHDKDLYAPVTVIDANRLAAVHLAAGHPRVAELVPWPDPAVPGGHR